MKAGIYCIKSVINGKIYIGQSFDLKQRLSKHKRLFKSNKHYNQFLQEHYNIYGPSCFEYAILELCEIAMLDSKEVFYINFYLSSIDNNGFNINTGGQTGFKVHDNTKQAIRSQKDCKKVYGFNLTGTFVKEWDSISNCAIELKVNPCDVRRTIQQKQRYCKGFVLNSEPVFRMRESIRGNHLKTKVNEQ